ncbi:MAG TPA: alkene reductase [Devosia sp.]|nr:alkene reductase [Devosia sp.]
MTTLWDPIHAGSIVLPHRFALAPMTRSRALPDGTPSALAAQYYAQRASLGLLITEGTQPSDDGQGYLNTPGIYTQSHIDGWRRLTTAAKAEGAEVFIQLMHVGRMAHPDNTPHHRQPLAPSAIASGQLMFTPTGMQQAPVPRALSLEDIRSTVQEFRHAARSAIDAGAAGVEIHGANGYLLHQFFAPNANQRDDAYGGSIQNRVRFAVEVAAAVADEIGPDRTGMRISPGLPLGGLIEGEDMADLYRHLATELTRLNLVYLHYVHVKNEELLRDIRAIWPNLLLLVRSGRTLESLADDVTAGIADIVPIGQWALANPDFVERFRRGAPLNTPDKASYYGGGSAGYTDYPTLIQLKLEHAG